MARGGMQFISGTYMYVPSHSRLLEKQAKRPVSGEPSRAAAAVVYMYTYMYMYADRF